MRFSATIVSLSFAVVVGVTLGGPAFGQAVIGAPPDQTAPLVAAPLAPLVPGIPAPVVVPQLNQQPPVGLTQQLPPPLPTAVTPPPLPAPPPPSAFFVEQNGQAVGPLTAQDLQQRIAAGTIKSDTLVWKQGTPDWVAAKDLPEVAALIPPAPPPIPAEQQYRQIVLGTWQAQTAAATGAVTSTTITYNADGTYSGAVTQTFQGLSFPQLISGTWTVQAVSAGTFGLTMTAGGFGSMPVTAILRVVDNNTLANDAQHYQARRIR